VPGDVEGTVSRHYARRDLETIIVKALRASGVDPDALKPDDLAPIDEFHMGGRPATAAMAEALALRPAMRVLDIGCGLGGAARYFAGQSGCRVTGIDLTPDYVEAAAALTRRVGLSGLVNFEVASALDLPFPSAGFDAATLIHVGMNLPDKHRLCREVARVLKPGGLFALYEVMRVAPGDLAYPTAWAASVETSFVAEPAVYRQALGEAGFTLVEERDQTELALASFRRARARVAERGLPPLGLHLLMGPEASTKVANMVAALVGGTIAPILMTAVRT
jgi:ubiquinone/menaquinone biosynthesis C-methylase UbiE